MRWLLLIFLIVGCAHEHKLNCTDMASHAGHSAEMRIGGDIFVAIDHCHAQAYIDQDGYFSWLTIDDGFLIEDSRCELQSIDAKYSLKAWDHLMKEIYSIIYKTDKGEKP